MKSKKMRSCEPLSFVRFSIQFLKECSFLIFKEIDIDLDFPILTNTAFLQNFVVVKSPLVDCEIKTVAREAEHM